MRKVGVLVFLDHRDNYIHGDLNTPEKGKFFHILFFDESTTYEEMIRMLIQEGRLFHLDDPRLHYHFVLQAFEVYWQGDIPLLPQSLSKPVTLSEGQTLASTHLTHLIIDESEFSRDFLSRRINVLFCATSIEIRDIPQPKEKSSSGSPNWIEVLSVVGGLSGVLYGATANAASIIGGLDVIERRWRERRTTTHYIQPQQGTSHLSGTDIVAIRLRMTQGPDHEFVEWLTDRDRLKAYIEAFKSNSIKPLQAIFVQRNNKALPVDVLEGAQNNLALDALLSYLNIDSKQK